MAEPTAITATMADQKRSRLAATMHRLFDDLREFVRAYAPTEEAQRTLPELDLVWVTGIERGPERVLLEAIAADPSLWAHAIPEDCCIVPRSSLAVLVGDAVVEGLAMHGSALVSNLAARRDFERTVHNSH